MKKLLCFALVIIASISTTFASEEDDLVKKIKQFEHGKFAYASINVIRKAPLKGLEDYYEVEINGQTLIIHKDGQNAIVGFAFDLESMTNLSQTYKLSKIGKVAKVEIEKLKEDNFVTFTPSVKKVATMYVFTDTTCGFCKKLHNEIDTYLANGVEVKYIPYPRNGMREGDKGYEEAKQIMCAADRNKAMQEIKDGISYGKYIKANYGERCTQTVVNGRTAGSNIGFSGTPFIYLSTGDSIPGYKSADAILRLLD
ncbi:DsbC family protein [Thalassotalea crassostreae]|uniref:DsbC family protein n=1 Tax=Thalassotalea crassostreae TaxID=1763536 RepID=UPI000837F9B8|nr:DsbC family protein [Thalassotalea crassostreae]